MHSKTNSGLPSKSDESAAARRLEDRVHVVADYRGSGRTAPDAEFAGSCSSVCRRRSRMPSLRMTESPAMTRWAAGNPSSTRTNARARLDRLLRPEYGGGGDERYASSSPVRDGYCGSRPGAEHRRSASPPPSAGTPSSSTICWASAEDTATNPRGESADDLCRRPTPSRISFKDHVCSCATRPVHRPCAQLRAPQVGAKHVRVQHVEALPGAARQSEHTMALPPGGARGRCTARPPSAASGAPPRWPDFGSRIPRLDAVTGHVGGQSRG